MNLAEQLFHTMTAVTLKQAAGLRPLSQTEKSLMEQSEAKAGPMLAQAQAYIDDAKKKTPPT